MTKIIKQVIYFTLLAIAIVLAWEFFFSKIPNPFRIKTIETTHSLILKEINDMGNLELASYQFSDIVEQRLSRDYLPDPKALLIVYGEATGCINLTEIKPSDIESFGDSVRIKMPEPYVCHFKIDHSKSKIYDSDFAFLNEELLFEEAYKSAEKKLLETAKKSDLLKTTAENASKVLAPLLEKVSDKKVILRF